MKPHEKECPVCGKLFPNPRSAKKRYCSTECRKTMPHHARRHGESRTRLHHIWCGMKTRCHGTTFPSIRKYYRDRGISVCREWRESYESFRDWSLANGYKHNLELDRIDVDGNYSPGNCRWINRQQQMLNTRVRSQKNKTSKYRGVQYMKKLKQRPWRAIMTVDGKPMHIGLFATEKEAARAYDREALRRRGEFANLNFT